MQCTMNVRVFSAPLWAVGLFVCVIACGCGDEQTPSADFEHESFYETLQTDVAQLAFHEGDWLEDWGDAAFFGLAYHAQAGMTSGDPDLLARADEAALRNLEVISDVNLLTGDVNEIAMSTLGLIEYQAATGSLDASEQAALSRVIDDLDGAVEIFNYYLDGGVVSGWAVDNYGPTSLTALVVLMNLQHAYLLGSADPASTERRVSWVREALASIDDHAWNGSSYDFGDDRPGLFLYPNVSMILANQRMYQLTGEAPFLARARDLYAAIAALRLDDGPGYARYRSPYSADIMGAQTEDYSTLSAQNYTLLSLLLFYEITGEDRFLVEYNGIVSFLADRLYGEFCRSEVFHDAGSCNPGCGAGEVCLGTVCVVEECQHGVLHHWMDGRVARVEDDAYFCAGCNLQLLYLLWYRQHNITR